MRRFVLIFIILYINIQSNTGARIFGSVSTPSFSHQVAFRKIWKELAKRGHEVILLTTDPMKENIENLRQIDVSSSYKYMNAADLNAMIANKTFDNPVQLIKFYLDSLIEVNRHQFQMPEVQQLINNKSEQFDLIMTEIVFPAHLGFLERFTGIPVIGLVSLDAPYTLHQLMGNEANPVLYPESYIIPTSYPLTLWQRIVSTSARFIIDLFSKYIVIPRIDEMIKQIFGENSRSIDDLSKEVDMLFVNSNPILNRNRALAPNTISFGGGSHVESASEPLDGDLLKFLDNAPNGVIYFSLGSNVKSIMLDDNLKQVFLDTFAELPYKVLWKFEGGLSLNKSDNIMINTWLPQNNVLEHPNVKLFISQCGLQSVEEAIMNHVPLIGLPFFADQPANADVLHMKGFGIRLEYRTLTKKLFKETITEVLTNPKYREKVEEVADVLRDVEMTGLEKVVWWTEYVIRNKGAKIFRNPLINVPWYQYYFLDVIAFVAAVVVVFLLITKKIISLFINIIFHRKSKIN